MNAQTDQTKSLFSLAGRSKHWFEGFVKNIGRNEFSYHSFRSDVGASLLTRCTDGQMAIEWKTQALPAGYGRAEAGFLWIAALDLGPQAFVFDVFVNGKKRFEITRSERLNWEVTTPDGGVLSFLTVERDQTNGAHGYMSMTAPKSWLVAGEGQTIRIVGRAHQHNAWIIVYQADDALSYLQRSIELDVWMDMELVRDGNVVRCRAAGPAGLAGAEAVYTSSGTAKTVRLEAAGDGATGSFVLPAAALGQPFTLRDARGEVIVADALGEASSITRLLKDGLLFNECTTDGGRMTLRAQRTYTPKTAAGLLALSSSVLANGTINLMNSSHQDIAWMDSPEKCVIERDTMLITPLLAMAEKDRTYRFDLEDALMVREYIGRHPEKKSLIREMLNDGRLSCGSTYIQPYEEMYSGESLARQFYLGAKWLKDEFGYTATVYWNEDVPGRTLQMPQLMKKAGTTSMMISRHERGLFTWHSPDGSFVTVFSPGHYGDAFAPLQKNFQTAAQYLALNSMEYEKFFSSTAPPPVIPLLSDNDMSPAKDYSGLIGKWRAIRCRCRFRTSGSSRPPNFFPRLPSGSRCCRPSRASVRMCGSTYTGRRITRPSRRTGRRTFSFLSQKNLRRPPHLSPERSAIIPRPVCARHGRRRSIPTTDGAASTATSRTRSSCRNTNSPGPRPGGSRNGRSTRSPRT